MQYFLDEAVSARPLGDGRYAVTLTSDWHTANGTPNGGYLLALVVAVSQREASHPDPLTVSANFLRPPQAGPAEVRVSALRQGRRVSTYVAELVQADKACVHALVTMHDWDAAGDVQANPHGAPSLQPPEACVSPTESIPAGTLPIVERFEYRVERVPSWLDGKPDGKMEQVGWVSAADQRPIDAALVAAMTDSFPPATANIGRLASATLEMTVHYRRRPTGTVWALADLKTRHVIDGYHDEDVELWDENGLLLAQSRQLAILS